MSAYYGFLLFSVYPSSPPSPDMKDYVQHVVVCYSIICVRNS